MHSLRQPAIVFVLWLVAALSLAQSPHPAAINEKIRQADELQDKGALQASQGAYESVLRSLSSDVPSQQLGHVLNGLSNVASSLGKNTEGADFAPTGRRRLPRDKRCRGASLRPDFKTEIRTLNNLGNAYYFPGNYLESLRSYQNAWQILEQHPAEQWSDYWRQITKINDAPLYQRLGRL